jgi:NAD(P)-dependent dehydrogenase (short-subunit alcohol dehydrogenase family)
MSPAGTPPPASHSAGRRVAVITGASGGIGAGLVAAFRHAGYSVVATSLSIRPLDDDDILAVQGDLTQAGHAHRVVKRAVDRFGRIDTLINTAGIFIGKPFTDYTLDDYLAITAVNLAGFFNITQPVIRHMLAQSTGGHIVNITTSLVDHPDSTRPSALASLTKGGLAAVTRSLAIEYASRGVRVNAVSPGVIKTPIHDPSSYEGMADLHPLGRIGEVSDIVDAILYLEGATFVTGEILHVDGGQAAGDGCGARAAFSRIATAAASSGGVRASAPHRTRTDAKSSWRVT